jgi:hypothetical protein
MTRLSAELAEELLLGKPAGDARGWYIKREYLKPDSKRERVARIALARELRKEAPVGHFVHLLAALIDPRPPRKANGGTTRRVIPKQTVQFVPPKGGRRASGRADLDIVVFMREWLAQDPKRRKTDAAVVQAKNHFDVSESRVWQAWRLFGD